MKSSPFSTVILVNTSIFLALFLSVGYGFAQDASFIQKFGQQVGFFGIVIQSVVNLVLGIQNRRDAISKAYLISAALPLFPAMFLSFMLFGR